MLRRLSAEQALVARDPGLPALDVLLDDAALTGWLASRTRLGVSAAHREYLRYKPGTSCVVAARARTPAGEVRLWLAGHTADGAAKLAKTARRAPAGAVLALDDTLHLLAATAAADRDLPGLAVLADPDRRRELLSHLLGDAPDGALVPLRHKPQRRWVARLEGAPVVLRVHRPTDAGAPTAGLRALAGLAPDVPALLGADLAAGVVAVSHAAGTALDRALLDGSRLDRESAGAALTAAGGLLARLHDHAPTPGLLPRALPGEVAAARAAAAHLTEILPALGPRARALAGRLESGLAAAPEPEAVPLHGDFSLDQVVVDHSGRVSLVDLDAAALGDPALDLACAEAALAAATVLGDSPPGAESSWLAALRDGYAAGRPLPDPRRLGLHTAAHLLRRAADPFRSCRPGWPRGCSDLLGRAEQAELGARTAAP